MGMYLEKDRAIMLKNLRFVWKKRSINQYFSIYESQYNMPSQAKSKKIEKHTT